MYDYDEKKQQSAQNEYEDSADDLWAPYEDEAEDSEDFV